MATTAAKMEKEAIEEVLASATKQFHGDRRLKVTGLPSHATEEDIKRMLEGIDIDINEVSLDKRSNTADVTLYHPEKLDSWEEKIEGKTFILGGNEQDEDEEMKTTTIKKDEEKEPDNEDEAEGGGERKKLKRNDPPQVKVKVSPTERVLCVAHLPLIYDDDEFQNLVQMYGPLTRSFLMRSEKTGHSKGYGFVEYASQEVALEARSSVEGKTIGNCTLHCDWLDPNLVTYESLHSKCLFVDHLPPEFRDVGELRNIFSVVVKPIYCQIVVTNRGENSGGIGLVEFATWQEAEEAQQKLNGHSIDKYKIRVTFCVPGVHAITIYNQLTADKGTNGKKPLLPDPAINPALCSQVQLLAMQNPQFFQSLQAIANSQLQNLQNNNQVHKNAGAFDKDKKKGNSGGLLGSPPPLNNNPNVQAAMVLLLAAQVQMRLQQPAMLGSPQFLNNLQNLIKQHNIGMTPAMLANSPVMNNSIQQLVAQMNNSANSIGGGPFAAVQNKLLGSGDFRVKNENNDNMGGNGNVGCGPRPFSPPPLARNGSPFESNPFSKQPLLPKPNTMDRNGRGGLLPTPRDNNGPMSAPQAQPINPWIIPPQQQNNGQLKPWDDLDCGPRMNQMDDNKGGHMGHSLKAPLLGDRPRGYDFSQASKGPLLGEKPAFNLPPMMKNSGSSLSPTSNSSSYNGDYNDLNPRMKGNDNMMSYSSSRMPIDNLYGRNDMGRGDMSMGRSDMGRSDLGRGDMGLGRNDMILGRNDMSLGRNDMGRNDIGRNDVGRNDMGRNDMGRGNDYGSGMGSSRSYRDDSPYGSHSYNMGSSSQYSPPLQGNMMSNGGNGNMNCMSGGLNQSGNQDYNWQMERLGTGPHTKDLQPPPCPPQSLMSSSSGPKGSLLGDYPWTSGGGGNGGSNTFQHRMNRPPSPPPMTGQKRKLYSLLPSPENSPENRHYIGQHSQGLGGHYADSYYKRIRN